VVGGQLFVVSNCPIHEQLTNDNEQMMLKNYIKIALRNLRKNKIDSAISIGGLAVGLACCILLVFYVRFEWSHDNFHENAEQIFRITEQSENARTGEIYKSLITPYPLTAVVDSTFSQAKYVLNIAQGSVDVKHSDKFTQQVVTYSDPGFFDAFTFPILYGNSSTPLANTDHIVLTEDAALRYFGTANAVDKQLTVRLNKEEYLLTVTAIAQNVPKNSSIKFDMVLPFENYFRNESSDRRQMMRENWYIGFGETWVVLNDVASKNSLVSKFPDMLKTVYGNFAEQRNMQMGLQSFKGAYFDQEYSSGITGNSNKLYSTILGGIAFVILAIAGMNFMSLTLTRAHRRSHEMGIRKASGAQSHQINFQIFGEVFVTCGISFVAGLMLAELANPFFQQVTGKSFTVNLWQDPTLWLVLFGMLLILTIITGSYPALRMARKKASHLFASQRSAERIPLFVKGLIGTQFALAITFLIATLTMNEQLNYLLKKDLGFSASNVVTVELDIEGDKGKQVAQLFSSEAQRLSGIQQISTIGGHYRSDPRFIEFRAGFGMGTMKSATTLEGFDTAITLEIVDEHYLETMDIELLAGRNFSPERPADIVNGLLVNQTFVETMGWDNPIGQIINDKTEGWTPPLDGKEVIGVVSDFHFKPLYEQLQPIALQHINSRDYGPPGTILVKASSDNFGAMISQLSKLWERIAPEENFSYNFLDEMVALQYMEEQRWQNIIRFASFMAIALACFGLFGLAALSAQRRTKEIGIRKVLGATLTNIVTLLSKDFVKLVVSGFIIAVPIAWYAVNQWLSEFAYIIEIGPGIFIFAGATALMIALLTVSWQSVKAAVANPVDSLRSE
jgi:putative ABC transport system permease protein